MHQCTKLIGSRVDRQTSTHLGPRCEADATAYHVVDYDARIMLAHGVLVGHNVMIVPRCVDHPFKSSVINTKYVLSPAEFMVYCILLS